MAYTVVNGRVHYVQFFRADMMAVREGIDQFDRAIANDTTDAPILLVSDSTVSGSLPIQHVLTGARQLYDKYGDDTFARIRIAFIVQDTFMIGTLITLLSLWRSGMVIRAFGADQEKEALQWLASFEEKLTSES